jgi:hypothetical protein
VVDGKRIRALKNIRVRGKPCGSLMMLHITGSMYPKCRDPVTTLSQPVFKQVWDFQSCVSTKLSQTEGRTDSLNDVANFSVRDFYVQVRPRRREGGSLRILRPKQRTTHKTEKTKEREGPKEKEHPSTIPPQTQTSYICL